MSDSDKLYSHVYKAVLTEEALDRAGRVKTRYAEDDNKKIVDLLAIGDLDDEQVLAARRMSHVYVMVAAFENSVRDLIAGTLADEHGADWWSNKVPKSIKEGAEKKREEELKTRWHGKRGDNLLNYVTLGQLHTIIRINHDDFSAFIPDLEWARSIFDAIERSRNVIMHSGELDIHDIARLGIFVKDWIRQVAS